MRILADENRRSTMDKMREHITKKKIMNAVFVILFLALLAAAPLFLSHFCPIWGVIL